MYVMVSRAEHLRKCVAVDELPRAPHVQRHALVLFENAEIDSLAGGRDAASVRIAQFVNAADLARERMGPQKEVDESGAGRFRPRHERACRKRVDNSLRELARIPASSLREPHRDVRDVISMRAIACPFHGDGAFIQRLAHGLANGSNEQLFQQGLQRVANRGAGE